MESSGKQTRGVTGLGASPLCGGRGSGSAGLLCVETGLQLVCRDLQSAGALLAKPGSLLETAGHLHHLALKGHPEGHPLLGRKHSATTPSQHPPSPAPGTACMWRWGQDTRAAAPLFLDRPEEVFVSWPCLAHGQFLCRVLQPALTLPVHESGAWGRRQGRGESFHCPVSVPCPRKGARAASWGAARGQCHVPLSGEGTGLFKSFTGC